MIIFKKKKDEINIQISVIYIYTTLINDNTID